jgi:hypothetical protein
MIISNYTWRQVIELKKVIITFALAIFAIMGCSKSDDTQTIREAAWNSLSTQDKQEVQTDWKAAKVEVAKVSDMPIPKGGGKNPEIEHLYKVSFDSKSDKTAEPIYVFVDGDTKKTVGYSKTAAVVSQHGPAPHYVTPKVSLNQNVVNLKDPLSISLNFKVDQDITLDETRLAFYQNGKQEPALSIPLTEWSHVSLERGDEKQKNITLIPSEKGLGSGYYQVQLEFNIGGHRIAAPSDLLIQYAPGTLRTGKIEINQSVAQKGYTLTVNSVTFSEDKVIVDVRFSPQVIQFFTEMQLEDGSILREFARDGTRKTEDQQFIFSPIPKSVHQATFEVVSINIQKPDGIYGVPGHWAITIPIH